MNMKRTIFSMLVFLSSFCTFIFFEFILPSYLPVNRENPKVQKIESFSLKAISNYYDSMALVNQQLYLSKEYINSLVDKNTNGISGFNKYKSSFSDDNNKAEESQYFNIGISIADTYVNIRSDANTDSDIMGKLYRDSAAIILDTMEDWYYIESGSVKGYIKSKYLKTGISDDELIEKYGIKKITVNADGLNVRKKPDPDSEVVTVIYEKESYPVIDLLDDWVKVDITDDKVMGYVKKEYVDILIDFNKAISKAEEEELKKIQEEERIKKETEIKYREEVNYTEDELKLLACLVHSEAGNQSYEGKLAVANVVLNRVKSSKYPNTIEKVIYQSGQFTVATNGSLAKQLELYDNYSSKSQLLSIKAAKAALSGENNIGDRLYFNEYKAAVRKGHDQKKNSVKIQDHLFW
ncbi:cell wall hydrolase [Herbinix luporum]|nr:cell wall hydrolase [Herbinix luporum]MDI9488705.1 cell wall hydrolase [Bacillota bacterium]HHT57196.1 cell wall hydrolase [Herbinix luporum]